MMNLRPKYVAAGMTAVMLFSGSMTGKSFAIAPKAPIVMLAAAGDNDDLDFTMRNRTGYDIKQIFIGKAGNKEFHERDAILHGHP